MKYSICSDTFPGYNVEDIFRIAKDTGYDAVELASYSFCDSITDVTAPERQSIRGWADAAGVDIAGIHALFTPIPNMQPLHSCPAGLQLNSADLEIREWTKGYLKELIRFCGEVGGKNVVLGSAKSRSIPEEIPYEEGWQMARETLRECAEYCTDYDVILSLEPIHAALTNFINTPDEAMKMVKDVDHPNLRWMLDCFAAYNQGVDVPKAIREHGKYLVHVHMNDENKRWPGTGKVDFPPIAQALKDIGYSGYLSLEVMDLNPNPETIAVEGLKAMRGFFE
jgi:sugar phosphate isomerase/epimerase